jgi:formamidopyrimidine-DNA glycosylase
MIELPEAVNLAAQLNATITGKVVSGVIVAQTPHKLAWYYGEPAGYAGLLTNKTIGQARAYGSLVEIQANNVNILFGEGVGLRFQSPGAARPAKHQFLIEFTDGSALSAAVQMYGGLGAFRDGELDNPYYKVAKEKPSPLSTAFNQAYFNSIIAAPEVQKLSSKALLATEQRIPGLGNGVLQDILFQARLHPKHKVNALTEIDQTALFEATRSVLTAMADQGGRDTELDMFGQPGKYPTILSKNTVNKPCRVCGTTIKKEAYMGGSIYYCEKCQKV